MKLFIISDIHGSEYYLKEVMKRYQSEKPDYFIILGDILYHGPRNQLPKGYNPVGVIDILNEYSSKIIAVRGNCDSEVDEMVLDFPIMSTYSTLLFNNRRIFLTHGHIYNEDNKLAVSEGDVVMSGHTHILKIEEIDQVLYLNPGSISIPKENNPHTYAVLENNQFMIKDLEGNIITEVNI